MDLLNTVSSSHNFMEKRSKLWKQLFSMQPSFEMKDMEMKRKIRHRTFGQKHGFIQRMISPSELGEITKPFVFLDYIHTEPITGTGFGWHPHSGIATFTYHLEGESQLEESTGNKVDFGPGDVEYFQAGSGAWHTGGPKEGSRIKGFQLWISLPPELEEEDAKSIFLKKEEFEKNENVTLLLGDYGGMKSKITPPNDMNYLEVNLSPNQVFSYAPPTTHDILWIQLFSGRIDGEINAEEGELILFEDGNDHVEFHSVNGAGFILGSAKKFEHRLVLGRSSVHTSEQALLNSQKKIASIHDELVRKNIIR